jgi:hypothetical protein
VSFHPPSISRFFVPVPNSPFALQENHLYPLKHSRHLLFAGSCHFLFMIYSMRLIPSVSAMPMPGEKPRFSSLPSEIIASVFENCSDDNTDPSSIALSLTLSQVTSKLYLRRARLTELDLLYRLTIAQGPLLFKLVVFGPRLRSNLLK